MTAELHSRGADAITLALLEQGVSHRFARALVVGCGSGREAAVLARNLHTHVVGIDLNIEFDPAACQYTELRWGDAQSLEFPDESFDFVYSYHALEHIPDYHRALQEMRRVLKRGGWFCVGTPNRERLLGYIGSEDADFRTKLRWNYQDWKAKLTGRFRNEYGAHAGFSTKELKGALVEVFGEAHELAAEYYTKLYPKYTETIRFLSATRLCRVVFPSIYFFGTRLR